MSDTDRFDQTYQALLDWASQAQQAGWLSDDDIKAIQQLETAHAESLFENQRPLLVAFFGGTGAGKSSLLNRLAGQPVAQVGIVRPTSHHVTLYLHNSYRDSLHEQALPTEQTRIVYHDDDSKKAFAWLDMPDIDSTEQDNRAIVESWLPFIDWLIYVVTPDRYQDDLGWQFLQARENRHAWLFVMNHWDEGVPEQWQDFVQRLGEQGFEKPIVLRTSCTKTLPDDDFPKLEQHLQQALKEHGLEGLQQVALQRQWQALKQQIDSLVAKLEQPQVWQTLHEDWQTQTRDGIQALQRLLEDNLMLACRQWQADEAANGRPPALQPVEEANESAQLNQICNLRCRQHLQALSLSLENRFIAHQLPEPPARTLLQHWQPTAEQQLQQAITSALARALDKPGSLLTRLLRRTASLLQWLLPLSAAGWIAYHVVTRFLAGTSGEQAFLGVNFAIHSALLLGLAWLIPWFILRQTRPSYAAAACRDVKQGIKHGCKEVGESLDSTWQSLQTEKARQLQTLQKLVSNL